MYKRIGIIGGMSPESTAEYYLYITREYTRRFGDYAYPEILICSVSFQPYVDWPKGERWDLIAQGLIEAARRLERAGADFALIATNTMHMVLGEVQAGVSIPVLSLLDAVGEAIEAQQLTRVGLLGTCFTMEKAFYQDALRRRGIEVIVPGPADRQTVNDVIYQELVAGQVREASRAAYAEIVGRLAQAGAQGVILGCTEIPLLLRPADVDLPLFDSTVLHAEAALNYALR